MDVALTVLFLGILIFLGNIFNRVFALTKIPDLLFLIAIGLLIGPVFGLVSPESFGIVGPIFTTVTLAIILFEGGLHLRVDAIKLSFRGTVALTISSFIATMLLATVVLYFGGFLTFLPALMVGTIIGGTSSAVVIPMIDFLHLRKDGGAILALESAVTDVLCIVVFLTVLDVYLLGTVDLRITAGKLIAALLMAVILGVVGGVFWSAIYHKLGMIKSVFLTPGFLFIIYGIVDMLGYSGAIAALAFGVTLGNLDSFKISRFFPSGTGYTPGRTQSYRKNISCPAGPAVKNIFLHLYRALNPVFECRFLFDRWCNCFCSVNYPHDLSLFFRATGNPGLGCKRDGDHDPQRTGSRSACCHPAPERCPRGRIYRNNDLFDHPFQYGHLFGYWLSCWNGHL